MYASTDRRLTRPGAAGRTALFLLLTACAATPHLAAAPPPHAEWELTFEDDFDGQALDPAVWESQAGPRGKDHLEARWPENNVLRDGLLHQVTRKETPPRGGKDWSTAHIWTQNFQQQYGYFEARMRYGAGLNNAFWLVRPKSARFPEPPHFEIDINEGHTPHEVAMTLHFFVDYGKGIPPVRYSRGKTWQADADLADGFHIYAVEWDKDEIVWYVDGVPRRRLENPNCHAPVDIRLSTVIHERSREAAGRTLEQMDGVSMDVDWVRVYRKTRDLAEPQLPPLEPCPIPEPVLRERQVSLAGTLTPLVSEPFDEWSAGALPQGWHVGEGTPAPVAAAEAGRKDATKEDRVLRLLPGDYIFRLLDTPVADRLVVSFDYLSPARTDGLLLVTLGSFDRDDPAQLATSYYTGDIGPYIHWRSAFIDYYTEEEKWQPFALSGAGIWRHARFVMDIGAGVFDYYAGPGPGEFESGGPFRHRQRAAHGIGLRHRGSKGVVFIDNLEVQALTE